MRLEKLEKNLALKALNACSIGRVRSYITKGVYDFMGSLSADIIFVNQKTVHQDLLISLIILQIYFNYRGYK